MGFENEWRYRSGGYDRAYLPPIDVRPSASPQRMLAGMALACVASACAWTLCVNLSGPAAVRVFADADRIESVGSRGDRLVAAQPRSLARVTTAAANAAVSIFDPRYFSGATPGAFSVAVASHSEGPAASTQLADRDAAPIAAAPAPPLRLTPNRTASLRETVRGNRVAAAAPTIFEKLFGKPSPVALAYASADDSALTGTQGPGLGRYDRSTAVYDISAHVVYMPDGTELEAHSGYGALLDDPRHADVHDRGVTPPNVYDLVPRESSFHGVQALRLIPVDETKVFGRSGLLAHSFMLGPNGDSNGCVSFKDYDAFLRAYTNHEIKRLVVVARLD